MAFGAFFSSCSETRQLFLERGGVNPKLFAEFLVGALLDFLGLLAGLFLADFVLHFGKRIDALLQFVEFFLESLELLIGLLLLLVGMLLALQEPDAQSDSSRLAAQQPERPIA